MPGFKSQQKKLLADEVCSKMMEYFMGLNKKNEGFIKSIADKYAKKIVQEYYDAIRAQYKKALKEQEEKKMMQQHVMGAEPVEQAASINLIAS